MEHMGVAGLPEPVTRAVEAMVQALPLAKNEKKEPGELLMWPGTVISALTHGERYDL
jgi:hypothetical protein